MKIESKIKRINGSIIELNNPDINYHFKPETNADDAPHVAEVSNEDHIQTLLAIKEGYCIAKGSLAEKKPNKTKEPEAELKGSKWKPAVTEYGTLGSSVKTSALVQTAFELSGLTAEQWNLLTDDEVKEKLSAEVEKLEAIEPDSSQNTGSSEGSVEGNSTPGLAGPETPATPATQDKPKSLTKAEKKAALEQRKAALGQH
ncbi:MAG: hypothetical protein WC733_00125 [Methylophilus sp.]|jgi:hypothetical protein